MRDIENCQRSTSNKKTRNNGKSYSKIFQEDIEEYLYTNRDINLEKNDYSEVEACYRYLKKYLKNNRLETAIFMAGICGFDISFQRKIAYLLMERYIIFNMPEEALRLAKEYGFLYELSSFYKKYRIAKEKIK